MAFPKRHSGWAAWRAKHGEKADQLIADAAGLGIHSKKGTPVAKLVGEYSGKVMGYFPPKKREKKSWEGGPIPPGISEKTYRKVNQDLDKTLAKIAKKRAAKKKK